MADAPGFDANRYPSAARDLQRNRAVTDTYEPGSTFKLVTVAGALSDGLVSPSTPFTLPYTIQVADRVIHDAEERGTETMSVAQILAHSSNVGAITLAQKLGKDAPVAAGSRASASGARPASTSRARAPASCCRPTSGRARRSATSRSDRASPSRRCRWPPRTQRSRTAGSGRAAPVEHVAGGATALAAPAPDRVAARRRPAERDAAERRRGGDGHARRGPRLQGGRQDRHRAEAGLARRLRAPALRRVVRRDGAGLDGRASWCSSPSTSRRARSGAASSRRRRSSRSRASTCSTSRCRPTRQPARPSDGSTRLGERHAAGAARSLRSLRPTS